LTLETGSPDALCPELEATREIVARRLGSLVVEGRKGWHARYTIGHTPAGNPRDFVRLELFDPEGAVQLQRDLPIEGDSCRTMSEVIALVLDRYFRGLMSAEQAPPESAPEPEAARASAAAPSSAPPSVAESAPEPSHRSNRPSLRASGEYAASAGEPWLGLRVDLGIGSRWEVGAGLRYGLVPLEEREPRGARVEARSVASRLSLAWTLALPAGLLRLGPTASVTFQRASTYGLAFRNDRTRALWTGGIEAALVLPVSRRLFLQAAASLDLLVPGVSGKFYVDEHQVLQPRELTLGAAFGFGYAWNK